MAKNNLDKKIECPIQKNEGCFSLCQNNNYQICSIYQSKVNQALSRLSLITQYGSDLNGDTD